jgi:hypothetical protein
VFRVVPLAERAAKLVYDTRGIWPDQPVPPHPPNKYFVRTSIAVPAPTCTSDLS